MFTKLDSIKQKWDTMIFLVMINGSLTRYVKLQVAHMPGMPATYSPPPTSKETANQRSQHASRHVRDARTVMHVGITKQRWRGKSSRHSRRMHNPQYHVSGKRSMHIFINHIAFLKIMINTWLIHLLMNLSPEIQANLTTFQSRKSVQVFYPKWSNKPVPSNDVSTGSGNIFESMKGRALCEVVE